MKHSNAMKALEEGKKIRRPNFEEGTYLELREGFILNNSGSIWNVGRMFDDWEIVQETNDFDWAIIQVRAGDAVRRRAWSKDFYLDDNLKGLPYGAPTWADIVATDWEIVP